MIMIRETLIIVFCSVVHTAMGHGRYRAEIPNGDFVPNACGGIWQAVGHTLALYEGHADKSAFGLAFKANNYAWTRALCREDSDGDGKTNGEELGDPNCQWYKHQTPSRLRQATGNPGMCEPGRPCRAEAYRMNCSVSSRPNERFGEAQWPFPDANDHPQSLFAKQMAGRPGSGGMSGNMFRGGRQRQIGPTMPQITGTISQGGGSMSPGRGSLSPQSSGIPNTHFIPGASQSWQASFPSREVFSQSLDQTNIQGRGRFQGFAPAVMPRGQMFGGQNIQTQVQARLQQERMRIPSSGTGWPMGSGDTRVMSQFGTSGTFAPMRPMGFAMSGGGTGLMMPSGMTMSYPMF